MIVVLPLSFSNNIKVLPRYYDDLDVDNVTIEIVNEDTRTENTAFYTNLNKSDGFFDFDVDSVFTESTTYRLKIYNTLSELVYFRGKIFATQQSKQNYLIHG